MSALLRILLIVALLGSGLGACGAPTDPCGTGQTVPTVTIVAFDSQATQEVVAQGQQLIFTADANPPEVEFEWTASGKGTLADATKRTVRYTAPKAVAAAEPVQITVKVTDRSTRCVSYKDINLRLLPPAGAAADPPKTLASPPELTSTPSPTPASPSPTPTPAAAPLVGLNVRDGDLVEQTVTLLGELPPNLKGDLWVFVVPPNGLLFPQSPNACKGAGVPTVGNQWELRVGFGGAGDDGLPFEIVLADANAAASKAIADTLRQWCRVNSYPGMQALPDGATELGARVSVTRNAERWGSAPAIPAAQLPGQVDITSLTNDDKVTQRQLLKGTYTGNVGGTIWVLVYASNGRWYPQSANACTGVHATMKGGAWQALAGFGGPGNVGEPFDVVVVLATAKAHAQLAEQQKKWCDANNFAGYLTIELPAGLAEKARVRVVRK